MAKIRRVTRGSRMDLLNWVERSNFIDQLSRLLYPTGAIVQTTDVWMPKGHSEPEEARLRQLGTEILPGLDWKAIQDWWLVHKRGANTPNWDLASTCTIQRRRGLVLIEAKAHTNELKIEGKGLDPNASFNSLENHKRIGQAIDRASQALAESIPGVNISRDTHYQLANRVAFSWKIATLGIPVILVYLGFLGDKGIADIGEPFRDAKHWEQELWKYMDTKLPCKFIDRWIDCGEAQMQMIIRSLPVE